MLQEGILWNSSARIEQNDHTNEEVKDDYVTKGNVTERGIIKFFMDVEGGKECFDFKQSLGALGGGKLMEVVSFSSRRKRASVVVKTKDGVRIYTKGAPDMLFEKLIGVIQKDGRVLRMNEKSPINDALCCAE